MSGLNQKDLGILRTYANKGNRELYWNYLAQSNGNDGYGLLALGVESRPECTFAPIAQASR